MKKLLFFLKMSPPLLKAVIKKMKPIDYIKLFSSIGFIILSIPALYYFYGILHQYLALFLNVPDTTIILIILVLSKLLFILFLFDKDLNRTKKKFLDPIVNFHLKGEEESVNKTLKKIKTKRMAFKKFELNKSYSLIAVNALIMQIISYIVLIFFTRNLAQLNGYTSDTYSEFFISFPLLTFLLMFILLMYNVNINGIISKKKNIIFAIVFALVSFIIVTLSIYMAFLFFSVFLFTATYRTILYIIAKKAMRVKYNEFLSSV